MTFIWPMMLFSLVLVPVFVGIYVYLKNRQKNILVRYGNFTGEENHRRQPGRIRHIPSLIVLCGFALLSVAMARPQMYVSLPKVEGTVILVFDVSGSMAAEDLQPNRITAAKDTAYEFVNGQPSTVQIGVVAFSESGISVMAPTNDKDAITTAISRLQPQQGTSLGLGIQTALNVLSNNSNAVSNGSGSTEPTPPASGIHKKAIIVLISDGENTAPPDPYEVAYQSAINGVRIDAIGIGTPQGADLHINGYIVHTQLNSGALEQISGLTGGSYYAGGSVEDLSKIYQQISPELVIKPEKIEITALMAGASLIFLITGGLLTLIWFGRLP